MAIDHEPGSGTKQIASPQAHAPAGVAVRREVESTTLLGGGRELLIHHAGETYTLRQTSKGKLILTK